jgi:hypothetical protein
VAGRFVFGNRTCDEPPSIAAAEKPAPVGSTRYWRIPRDLPRRPATLPAPGPRFGAQEEAFLQDLDVMLDLRLQYHRGLLVNLAGSLDECADASFVATSCWIRFDVDVNSGVVHTLGVAPLKCYGEARANQLVRLDEQAAAERARCLISRIGTLPDVTLTLPVDSPLASYSGPLDVNFALRRSPRPEVHARGDGSDR